MGQKGRTDLVSVMGSNIFDNNNKEITAAMVRNMIEDIIDSKFNLVDDELKGATYQIQGDTKTTLEQYLNNVIGAIPLHGSTDWFDPGSTNGNIQTYGDNGIVSSMDYEKLGTHDCLVRVHFFQPHGNRKFIVNYFTDSQDYNNQNDLCAPVIFIVSSKQINVAIREVSGNVQKVRLQIIAI